jgi:hypothetical protein
MVKKCIDHRIEVSHRTNILHLSQLMLCMCPSSLHALRKGLEVAKLCTTGTGFPALDNLDAELTAITDGALGEDNKAERINTLNEQLTTATAKANWAFWSNDLL